MICLFLAFVLVISFVSSNNLPQQKRPTRFVDLANEQAAQYAHLLPKKNYSPGLKKPKFLDFKNPTIWEYPDSELLSKGLCGEVRKYAINAINMKGSFNLCIPGGSALKLLAGLKDIDDVDWSRVNLFYINHKCVPSNDSSATHLKAKKLFLDAIELNNAFMLEGVDDDASIDSNFVATNYEQRLRKTVPSENIYDIPTFDLMVIGVGKDGHIGSLYPGRPEIKLQATDKLVVPVDKVF